MTFRGFSFPSNGPERQKMVQQQRQRGTRKSGQLCVGGVRGHGSLVNDEDETISPWDLWLIQLLGILGYFLEIAQLETTESDTCLNTSSIGVINSTPNGRQRTSLFKIFCYIRTASTSSISCFTLRTNIC